MKKLLAACSLLSLVLPAAGRALPEIITPSVCRYEGTRLLERTDFPATGGTSLAGPAGTRWNLAVRSQAVPGDRDARDYVFTWKLLSGEARQTAVAVEFAFPEWRAENFVFVPAAVYDGNKFSVKRVGYPPYWYDKSEWRLDMPTTTNEQPSLGTGPGPGLIELTTGSAATPLMAFHAPDARQGWMVLTEQGSRWGNHGLTIVEDASRTSARFTITAPAVRNVRPGYSGFVPSGDRAADWQAGDSIALRFRVYRFRAPERTDLMRRFMAARKELNPASRAETLPFSEMYRLVNRLFQEERWDDSIDLFCLSEPGPGRSWNQIWQLGWVGGGQATLPMLMQGTAAEKERARRNIEAIFARTQAPSGFFNAYGDGRNFVSFGYGSPLENDECLVRSQGDWLYMAQRQFELIAADGGEVPEHWRTGLKKQADAFLRLWNEYGQFGHFVNVRTGDLLIGGSVSGGIVPGGLALASRTWGEPAYLRAAEAAARNYYADFVKKGYTTAGPGEILSAPDSESAFGLFESFMALYEVTGSGEWLRYAADLLPVCASWTVSYDFRFPAASVLAALDARSCGSVWASVANKHSAPGICDWSGDCLLKYYRASGDARALELLADIAHGFPQYISRADRPIGGMPSGGSCERVNLSDWEGRDAVGGNIFGSCSWVETAALLTAAQLPGIYVQPDRGVVAVFDHVTAERLPARKGTVRLRLTNPTAFPADVRIFSEPSSSARREYRPYMVSPGMPTVRLAPGESREVVCDGGEVRTAAS